MEPADTDDVVAADDGEVAGTVQLPDGDELPVTLDADLVERAQAEGVDIDRLRDAAVPSSATVDLTAQTDGDSTATIPVQDRRQTDLTSRRKYDRQYQFIDDDQIRRLIRNSVDYTERVGHFLLARDDLIPTVKERLKALIVGEDGLGVEPADPDSDADQRLADHLAEVYEDDIRPTNVIDSILRENMMNARAVLRATDLAELDLSTLDYLKDGISGEEIYVQDRTTVYEFDITEQPNDGDTDTIGGIDLDTRTIDSQALIIGEHVFDISLYDTPPLEAVADTAVNKMVLQRLKARKAEITSFGAVYAKVKPPSYLPEDQYFDRVADDDWDGDGEPPTKLERALEQNIQNAFDTLKDFQSGTVMSVPDFWELEQLDIPETDDPIDDQIRGYNRDISRRLLVPLDLIELQSGSELSRETMFATLMTTVAGWRREIKRVFDQFAEIQAEIEGISGDVDHTFPPLKDANAKQVISALKYAGVAGLSQKEVRQMMNTVQGIDLETDDGAASQPPQDGSAPPDGGPDDPERRAQQMRDLLDDQRRGQDQPPAQRGQQDGQDGADVDAAAQEDVDLSIPDAVQNAAQQALDARDDSDVTVNGMTDTGWDRAEQLAAGGELTRDDILGGSDGMAVWWARHFETNIDTSGDQATVAVEDAHEDNPWADNSYTAAKGWGGVAGARFAFKKAAQLTDGDESDDWRDWVDRVQASAGAGSGNPQSAGGAGRPATAQDGSDGPTDKAAAILRSVPFLPDPQGDQDVTITKNQLGDWLAWVRAGRPDLQADRDWNPALHPRGPDGKFVERPYDIPDDVVSEIRSSNTAELLGKLVNAGELSNDDLDALLGDPKIHFDDVPDDINNFRELQGQRRRGGSKMRPALEDIPVPDDASEVKDSKNWTSRMDLGGQFERGDVVLYRTDAPRGERELKTAILRNEGPMGGEKVLEGPDGETFPEPEGPNAGILAAYTPGDRDRLNPDEPVQDPSLLDVSVDDPRFTTNFDKTAVDEGDFLKVSPPATADRDDDFVAEVTEKRFSGAEFTVETQDGETMDIGAGTGFEPKALLDVGPTAANTDVDDPAFDTDIAMGAADDGDVVRVEKANGDLVTATVTDGGMKDPITVETASGETLEPSYNKNGDPPYVDAVLKPGSVAAITPDDFQTLDDVETVDLTERSGSPAERRQGVDQGELLTDDPIPASMVENEEIPEGALIARESDGRFTIGRVTGYSESFTGDKEIEFTTAYGRTHTERAERVENRGYRPYKPRAKADVTIDGWGDDDTALAKRKEAVRDVLDQVVPAYQDHDEVNAALGDIPIEDGNFDRVKDQVADHLARAKDKEHAETVIARLSAIGDDKSRASASPDVSAIEENRTRFQIEPEDTALAKTDHHEMGHSIGMAYGFRGGSNDKDGETYPVTNFAWNSPDFDVPDKYGMPMRPAADGFEDGTSMRNQPMYQQGDDWTSEVERQVGTGLDGRNFTNVDGLDDLDISEGSMIQLRDEPSYGDPRNWRFADVREPGDDDPFAEAAVTLEAKDGTTQEATIETAGAGGQPRIDWADSADYLTFEDIQRSRKSTPDDWREDPPDADDWLGQDDDTADPDSKMATLADRVNKAWYRQAVAAREQDDDRASRYVIKNGYSSKQGHETMSRIHEVMRKDDITASERAKAAQTLVRYHPDLLEAYRALYDIPANMKVTLNHVLEREGHDFRFEGAPMMNPPGDLANPAKEAVDDLYENGGDA